MWRIEKIIKKICKVSKTGKIFKSRLLLSDQLFYSRLSWQQSNSSSPHIDRDACPPQVFLYLNVNISWQQSNSSSSSSSHIDRSVLSCWQSSSRLLNSQVGSPGTIKISLESWVFNASKQQSSRQTERAQISVFTQDWHFQYNCCAKILVLPKNGVGGAETKKAEKQQQWRDEWKGRTGWHRR